MSLITCDCLHVTINQIPVTFFLLLYACIHPSFPDTEGGNIILLLYKKLLCGLHPIWNSALMYTVLGMKINILIKILLWLIF